jgi:hypothetical protein
MKSGVQFGDQVSGDGICPETRLVKKAGRHQEVPWSP